MTGLLLCATITRTDADGTACEYDATITFTVESYTPGYPATRMHPGEGPEIECAFEHAELIAPPDGDGPLTEAELATLRAWFAANHDRACEAARDTLDHANDNVRTGDAA